MMNERGFSTIKLLMLLAVIGGAVVVGYNVFPVYNTYWKVEESFESVTRNMSNQSVGEIRNRLPEIFDIKYLSRTDLPKEFYEHLEIEADGNRVQIKSSYHVTVWLLGPPVSVDPDSEYKASDVKGMDKLRLKTRLDFDFEPHAETP